jgi:CRISPR-associated protein Csd1
MLLQRLVEYAQSRSDAIPAFHRDQEFRWQLDLTADGEPVDGRLLPLEDPDGRGRGIRRVTPAAARTVGVAANLAADDLQYVLGWADADAKPDRVARCHKAFVELTAAWAASEQASGDPGVQAAAAFYARPVGDRVRREPEFSSKDRVLISVNGQMLFQRPSVVPFWTAEVARRKGGGTVGLCLVCGTTAPLLDTVPGKIPARYLPGAGNDAALVSVNERVFGYDLSTQLGHSPICLSCGEAVSAGLLAVLEGHSTSHGGQDSRTAWWTVGNSEFDVMEMIERADPDDVTAFLRRMRQGRPLGAIPQPGTFLSLTVGGNIARVIVRDWVEMPLTDLERHARQWFTDHEIVSSRPDGQRVHSLARLVLACGRWDRQRGRYADMGSKTADRPADLRRVLHRAAVRGDPLPPALLAHLLHRIATDGHLDDARVAMIRLCLTRHPQTPPERMPMPDLEPATSDPAYVAGRLFAVLEQIQYDASGGKLNTTYADRHFAGALTSPRTAIVAGRKDAAAWLKKLRRDRNGAAVNHDKRLSALCSLLPEGQDLPARCSLRQQARFVLGYHHERADHFAAVRARSQRLAQGDTRSTATDPDPEGTPEEND